MVSPALAAVNQKIDTIPASTLPVPASHRDVDSRSGGRVPGPGNRLGRCRVEETEELDHQEMAIELRNGFTGMTSSGSLP